MLWLERGPGGWALPRWSSTEQRAADVARLTRAAADRLGTEVSVLRCLSDLRAGEDGVRHQVHDLDAHGVDAAWSPAGSGRWFGAAEVEGLPLARAEHRPVLAKRSMARRARQEAPDGRDWVLPGWRDEVALWVDGQLSRHGLPPLARMEQVLAPLHHAVQFRLGLWRIETSWEVRAYLPDFLRRLLDGLPPCRGAV